jgi:V/A-type H+-transporting ATPase subunit B
LKQQVIGKVTREDHGDLANAQIRLYADSKKAKERQSMGFKLSKWDEKLLQYGFLFEDRMMNLEVNYTLEEALTLGWQTLSECFDSHEVGIKQTLVDKFWPKQGQK